MFGVLSAFLSLSGLCPPSLLGGNSTAGRSDCPIGVDVARDVFRWLLLPFFPWAMSDHLSADDWMMAMPSFQNFLEQTWIWGRNHFVFSVLVWLGLFCSGSML